MKKLLSVCVIFLSFLSPSHAQLSEEYSAHIKNAEESYAAKDYKASADYYSKAFKSNDWKGTATDRYNAACSWSLAGNADSAFFQLERIVTKMNYTNLGHITSDTDLDNLHKDKRWNDIISIVKQNKDKAEEGMNKPVIAILDTVFKEDQSYRMQIEGVIAKYGRDSKEVKDLWKVIEEKDAVNLKKVVAILDKYGWMGPEEIGGQGNQTLFLVIQHADLDVQLKYLPAMREAVKNRKAQPSALALLEDRVALRQGKRQIYGSQVGMDKNGKAFVSPLEDPDNVDKRRAEVGLQPLADYVRNWQIEWDVEKYKKELPAIEKDYKY